MVGASGGIAGLIGYVFIVEPLGKYKTYVFPVFMVDIYIWFFIFVWIVSQLFLLSFYYSGNIAFSSHFSGFIIGAILGLIKKGLF